MVEQHNAASEGLRFHSFWGLRIFPYSFTWDEIKQRNIILTSTNLLLDFFCSLSGLLLFDLAPGELERSRLLERFFLSFPLSLSLSLLRGLSFFDFLSALLLRERRFLCWLSFSLSFFLGLWLRLLLDDVLWEELLSDRFLFLSLSLSRSRGFRLVLALPFSGLLLRDLFFSLSLFLSRLRERRLLSLLDDLERDLFLCDLFKTQEIISSCSSKLLKSEAKLIIHYKCDKSGCLP